MGIEAGGGDRYVGHRHLPGADHLIASYLAGDGTVADGDQEAFRGHRGQAQHPIHRFAQVQVIQHDARELRGLALKRTGHLRRLAKQHAHGQIDRFGLEVAVAHFQVVLRLGFAHYRVRAALALTQRVEGIQVFRGYCQYVALLGFVTPDFQRAHARLGIGHRTQVEQTATVAVFYQLRQGVRQPARAYVVNEANRVFLTQRPAAIDDFLGTALNFRVFPLHRGEVQVRAGLTGGHAGGRTTAQADQHRRAAHDDQLAADRDLAFLHVLCANVAVATGNHDRLVVAATRNAAFAERILLVGAEVAGQVGAAKLVIERGTANRAVQHDIECGLHALGLAVVEGFPGLNKFRNAQVRNGKAGQTCFWLAADAGSAFVPNLTARAGGRTGERRNGRGVVVGLHLHQNVDRLLMGIVAGTLALGTGERRGEEASAVAAFDHRRVIAVRREHVIR